MKRALLLVLAACSGSSPDAPAAGSGSGSAAVVVKAPVGLPRVSSYPTPAAIDLPAPKVELPKQESLALVDAGTGPRAPLRYALAAGTVFVHAETKLVSRHLEGGAFGAPQTLPAIRDGFAASIDAAAPSVLALRALPGELAAKTPEAEQYLASWRKLLENRHATAAFDARGQLGALAFADDPGNARSAAAKDELAQRLLATTIPLPAEPVGAGARWTCITILRQGNVYVKQTATYTLAARTKTAWTIHAKLLRVGEEQRVADPSLPRGATADLVALFRLLEGDVTVDPSRALVAAGSLAIESRIHARVQLPGQPALEQLFEDTGTVTFSTEESR